MLFGLAGGAPLPRKAASLCRGGETPLFSCPIGAKLVSVCGGAGGAIYRYGRPGRVELTTRNLTQATRGYAGGGETQITATVGPHTYTVYDRTERTAFDADGRHDARFSDGLIVRLGSRTLLSKACGAEPMLSSKAQTLIPKGAFIEH